MFTITTQTEFWVAKKSSLSKGLHHLDKTLTSHMACRERVDLLTNETMANAEKGNVCLITQPHNWDVLNARSQYRTVVAYVYVRILAKKKGIVV